MLRGELSHHNSWLTNLPTSLSPPSERPAVNRWRHDPCPSQGVGGHSAPTPTATFFISCSYLCSIVQPQVFWLDSVTCDTTRHDTPVTYSFWIFHQLLIHNTPNDTRTNFPQKFPTEISYVQNLQITFLCHFPNFSQELRSRNWTGILCLVFNVV